MNKVVHPSEPAPWLVLSLLLFCLKPSPAGLSSLALHAISFCLGHQNSAVIWYSSFNPPFKVLFSPAFRTPHSSGPSSAAPSASPWMVPLAGTPGSPHPRPGGAQSQDPSCQCPHYPLRISDSQLKTIYIRTVLKFVFPSQITPLGPSRHSLSWPPPHG